MDQLFRICRSRLLLSIPDAIGIRKPDQLACRCQHRPILGAQAAQCLADDHPQVCPLLEDVCQRLSILSAAANSHVKAISDTWRSNRGRHFRRVDPSPLPRNSRVQPNARFGCLPHSLEYICGVQGPAAERRQGGPELQFQRAAHLDFPSSRWITAATAGGGGRNATINLNGSGCATNIIGNSRFDRSK